MADTRILEQETFIDDSTVDAEQARMAADDLRHIEEEVKQEAEASVEDYDDEGSETCSVEAAGTAFDFDEAERLTDEIADDVVDRIEDDDEA